MDIKVAAELLKQNLPTDLEDNVVAYGIAEPEDKEPYIIIYLKGAVPKSRYPKYPILHEGYAVQTKVIGRVRIV